MSVRMRNAAGIAPKELRVTSVLMTADDCQRVRRQLAAEYEAVAEQWAAISVLTALLGTK
jgi:hypothetical protein